MCCSISAADSPGFLWISCVLGSISGLVDVIEGGSRIWCILSTIALFLIPFSLCFFRSFVLVLSRVSRVVQFFGMGVGGVVGFIWSLRGLSSYRGGRAFSCHYFFSPLHDAVLAIVPPPSTFILDPCDIWSIMSGSNPLIFLSLGIWS
jgi:hypothetical protein